MTELEMLGQYPERIGQLCVVHDAGLLAARGFLPGQLVARYPTYGEHLLCHPTPAGTFVKEKE